MGGSGRIGYHPGCASVAQWIERFRPKEGVGGSIPSGGASASLLGGAFPLELATWDSRGEVA